MRIIEMSQTDNETVNTAFDLNFVIITFQEPDCHLVTTCAPPDVSWPPQVPILPSPGSEITNPDKNDTITRLMEE